MGDKKVSAVVLDDGTVIETDLLLFSVGIRSNTELVKNSGLQINRGIVVNERMETSIPDVYAAGDVCEYNGRVAGIWHPALEQAKVAGANMAGDSLVYKEATLSALLSAFDTKIFSAGDVGSKKELSYEISKQGELSGGSYKKLYAVNNELVGGILIGDTNKAVKLLRAVEKRLPLQETLQILQ